MPSPTQDFGQASGEGPGQSFGQEFGQTSGGSSGTAAELKSDAKQLGSTASNRLHSELDARKGTAATQVRSLSSAFGQAGEGLDENAPQWLRAAFQQGAQKAQMFADSLEQKDSRAIMSDIQDLARNNPGAFIAGCAALGFAAARIFKAGGPDESAPAQSRTTQLPPVQGEEPLFRSTSTDASASASTGEYV